ncbi:hypothetical protein [Cesiribacter andamanensis]|uniref:Lipocalin-like domain-containing protein n=1 Tax=Cesiribacter andamanensis AMV16 TaxID=1279009 RepID=M7N5J6_9BACT|nr:hypothetical protein [Cesiribacter andamanensis]EMR03898.1 hypothetical protein ADICEAN_00955 [Cesiribacter andamanensis AMV16]
MKPSLLLSLLILFASFACSDKEVVPSFHEKRALLVDQNWKVGLLSIDDGADESANYQRLSLDFGEQNSLVATSTNGQSFFGTWAYTQLETGNDQLRIQFTGSDLLDRLNRNWQIESFQNSKIELRSEGPGQSGLSRLQLVKQ